MASFSFFSGIRSFFSRGATANTTGQQNASPSSSLIPNSQPISEDAALQISALWACLELRASIIASLPIFVYKQKNNVRLLAKDTLLYDILHNNPNSRMTPFEFMRAIVMSLDLRGGAYVRLVRNTDTGEVFTMWPMSYDQVEMMILDGGKIVYKYSVGDDVTILDSSNVMHIKGLGNGTTGLDRLSFMRAATGEARDATQLASTMFRSGGRVSGVLTIDSILTPEQRAQIQTKFNAMSCEEGVSALHVLEAGMKYQPLGLSPQDQQLIESRRFGIEEICSFMGVPPVLINRGGTTTWGTGIAEIKEGFYTLSLAPICVNIQQAIYKSLMTAKQRAEGYTAEFSTDALLRANLEKRAEIYAKMGQNGIYTRNFMRSLENLPPLDGGDDLTVQSNLLPINKLGTITANGGDGSTIQQ